jgi:hypothetical protein
LGHFGAPRQFGAYKNARLRVKKFALYDGRLGSRQDRC